MSLRGVTFRYYRSCSGFLPDFPKRLSGFLALLLLAFCICASAASARSGQLVIEVGKGLHLQGTEEAETVFVADPDVADLSASPGEAHFVYGKQPGETTVIGVDLTGSTLFSYDVIVIHNLDEVQRMIAYRFPGTHVTVQSARGSVYVSGTVADERIYDAIMESLRGSIPDGVLIDEIIVTDGRIIRLDVKFMEVARDQLEIYGVSWSVLTSSRPDGRCKSKPCLEVNALLKLLLDTGVATVLSETTLTTTSKKKASFMVGEELAIPHYAVSDAETAPGYSVDYRFVGLNVGFTPSFVPGEKIHLAIESEISNVHDTAQFINGDRFANIATRKVDTSVDLASGEDFILAGLSRLDTSASLDKPRRNWGLLGELSRWLFGRDNITSRQRDLIVVVTPFFGEPDKPVIAEVMDLQQSNLEYILARSAEARGERPASVRLYGPAGFLY